MCGAPRYPLLFYLTLRRPSDYRGRLWIHAASHQATPEEIEEVCSPLRKIRHRPFPTSWPISALIGCVDVVDNISQNEYYRRQEMGGMTETDDDLSIPRYDEDTPSDYLWLCVHPRKLLLPIGMSGQHKLWKLPKNSVKGYAKQLKVIE